MHKLMTGEDDSFDKSFYNELISCINKYDPELMDVINAQWKGFRTYAEDGGNPGVDDWQRCDQYGVSNIKSMKIDFVHYKFTFVQIRTHVKAILK